MAQLVQGDVAQGDVFLELRGAGDPVAQALGQDQGVIAQAQGELRGVRVRGGAAADGQGNVLRAEGVAGRDAGGAGAAVPAGSGAADADGDVAVAAVGLFGGFFGGCLGGAHRCFTPSLLV